MPSEGLILRFDWAHSSDTLHTNTNPYTVGATPPTHLPSHIKLTIISNEPLGLHGLGSEPNILSHNIHSVPLFVNI